MKTTKRKKWVLDNYLHSQFQVTSHTLVHFRYIALISLKNPNPGDIALCLPNYNVD